MRLDLEVTDGRRGSVLGTWTIVCRSILELSLSDLDGGGIDVYSHAHPAAKQYTDSRVRLSFRPSGRMDEIMGAAIAAQLMVADEWIPFDRYIELGPPKSEVVVWRGPAFLMQAYARAISDLAVRVSAGKPQRHAPRVRRPKVLHFGESYVVAGEFDVTRGVASRRTRG